MSEKGVPTFYPRQNGLPSTIDLTWGNWLLAKHNPNSKTLTNTYGSDHQALQIQINREAHHEVLTRNTANIKNLDKILYQLKVENQLSNIQSEFETEEQTTAGITQITNILTDAFYAQGKTVKDNKHRQKAWWDETKIRPLIQKRNRARRWMILSRLPEAEECYWN